MNRFLKRIFSWISTLFTPIGSRIAGRVQSNLIGPVRDPVLATIRKEVGDLSGRLEHLRHDTDLGLDSCTREIARLELQIEALRDAVEELIEINRSQSTMMADQTVDA